ncbi:MAG: COX15/CtaA family protein, partial [Bdellovibrionales bacterium]|nr:COX15/CtaA family protein [Bdellovibrionales bacterium]
MNGGGNYWLPRICLSLPFLVLFLIFAGALVTSHNAGLAVPDWPTTFGENMFLYHPSKWQGIIFYEHGHRLLAALIGVVTLCVAIWLSLIEKRKWVKIVAALALLAVVLQGLLGGLTVLWLLPPAVSVMHAMLAQSFLLLVVVLAYSQWGWGAACFSHDQHDRIKKLSLMGVLLLYLQLLLGAAMRHTASGLAITDFPLMGGSLWPSLDQEMLMQVNSDRALIGLGPVTLLQVGLHLAHRLGGVIVAVALLGLSFTVLK